MILCVLFAIVRCITFDAKNSEVIYSGIASGVILPVYYFQLNLADEDGNLLISSPEIDPIVEMRGQDDQDFRAKVEILNFSNGKYMVRIKTWFPQPLLVITVTDKDGNHFQNSPAQFEYLNRDDCTCPVSVDHFKTTFDLEMTLHDVLVGEGKLSYRENGNRLLQHIKSRPNSIAICHYAVKDQRVFRQCYGQHVGFNMFSDATLLSLLRKVKLSDVEFWINLGDWPQQLKEESDPFQILSWSSHEDFLDIIMPTYDLLDTTFGMMHRVTRDQFSVQQDCRTIPWSEKIEKGFFRGRDSRQERLDLAELSVNRPDLVDAAITNYFFFKKDELKYGPKSSHVPFAEHFKYKYQVNVDGTVAAYRLPYLLLGNSVVLKQDSPYFEHFYKHLKPWKHFIPLARNLSDLEEKVKWAREHDDQVQTIMQAANEIVHEHVAPIKLLWSWISTLEAISASMTGSVVVSALMEEVTNEVQKPKCQCRPNHTEL